ncbi:MAG: hypothetical protein AABW57_01700 [Nanoarchaeota archaeon]
MIEYLVKYLSEAIAQEGTDALNRLKKSDSITYQNAKEFALYLLEGLDWCDERICKRFGIDYVNFLHPDNFVKIMNVYIRKKDEELYKIYKKIHRRRS